MEPQHDAHELMELIAEQRAELRALRCRVEELAAASSQPPRRPADSLGSATTATDRRHFFRRAGVVGGAAAGAAIVGLGTSRPVAADDGDALTIGEANDAQSSTTLVGGPDDDANIFTVGDGATTSDRPAAVGAFAQGTEVDNGLYAFSATGHAVIARAAPDAKSHLLLMPTSFNPAEKLEEHETGEVIADVDGNVWHCVAGGNPGAFRQLSGPATAGSLTPINPIRVYDARFDTAGADGLISTGENRLIPTRDELSLTTGNVLTADVIPPGTFAIAYNIAVFDTVGTGYLYVAPANNTDVTAATINWSVESPGPLSNASIVKVEQDRQVRVFCGGAAPTGCRFTIDVVGYYR